MTTKKASGLANFVKKPEAPVVAPAVSATTAQGDPADRKRGNKDTVALTVRLPRADWMRVHALALDQGVSIQTLAVRGLSKIFEEQGLPGIMQ